MGKMKDLGQQLTEKLEQYANAQQARNIGMLGAQQMSMLGSAQAAQMSGAAVQHTILQGGHYGGGVLQPQASKKNIKVDNPNTREAYVIPLSRLVNLWRAKFGDLWVDVSEIEDEFWMDASSRLHRNKLMEEIEFRESNTPWARLKEDA